MNPPQKDEDALAGVSEKLNESSQSVAHPPGVSRDALGQWRKEWLRAAKATEAYRGLRPKTDRLLLARITLKYANPVEGFFTSQRKIADELGLARGTVNYSLSRLVEAGFLIRSLEGCDDQGRRFRGKGTMGGQTTNVYFLNPALLPLEETITPSEDTVLVTPSVTPSVTPEVTLESYVDQKALRAVNQKSTTSAREERKSGPNGPRLDNFDPPRKNTTTSQNTTSSQKTTVNVLGPPAHFSGNELPPRSGIPLARPWFENPPGEVPW